MPLEDVEKLVDELSLEEQVSLLSGEDFWSLPTIARLGIGKLRVTDGPNGARGSGSLLGDVKSAAFPVGIAIGASWDPGTRKTDRRGDRRGGALESGACLFGANRQYPAFGHKWPQFSSAIPKTRS